MDIYSKIGQWVGDRVYERSCNDDLADFAEFVADIGSRILVQAAKKRLSSPPTQDRTAQVLPFGYAPIPQPYGVMIF